MIIPSIDIMGGHAVQLVQGKEKKIDAGDPLPIAQRFGRVGEVAVIDLDAAMGQGSNAEVIESLLSVARCRVGGGIRDVETARRWLDRGAEKVILGTAARPEILRELPKERVIAALDAKHGEVVVEGWKTGTRAGIAERMDELARIRRCGFLVTFVEHEGTMRGFDVDRAVSLLPHAQGALLYGGGRCTLRRRGRGARHGGARRAGRHGAVLGSDSTSRIHWRQC